MSVFTSNSSNRLLTSSSIRTGHSSSRLGHLMSYGNNGATAPQPLMNFLLRIFAIIGLSLAVYLLFQPDSHNLIAKPTDMALPSVQFLVENGSGTIARSDGLIELMTVGSTANVNSGDMIVAEDGIVQLQFPQGQLVVMDPGASVTIEQLEYQNEIQRTQLVVWSGRIQYTAGVERTVEDYFYVSSTSSSSRLNSGTLVMEVVTPVKTLYKMIDGTATIQMREHTIELQTAQHLEALLGDPLVVELNNPIHKNNSAADIAQAPATIQVATDEKISNSTLGSITSGQSIVSDFVAPVQTHKVQAGDTLWSIAVRYNLDVETIKIANPSITDIDLLQIGQNLHLPIGFAATTGTTVATN